MAGTAADNHASHAQSDTGPSNPLAGKRVVFTGKLASLTRREAHELVRQFGGRPSSILNRRTRLLVVGEQGWPLAANGGLQGKLRLATRLQRLGWPLEIVPESEFLSRLGLREHQEQVHRHYTLSMLSRMLDVPLATLRAWARRGLIRPAREVYRLQYFDFQEVAGAKVLARLVAGGISAARILQALTRLRRWLPGVDRPLTQLAILAEGHQLLVKHDDRFVEPTGQRLFDFAADQPSAAQDGHAPEGRLDTATSLSCLPLSSAGLSAQEWFALAAELEAQERLPEAAEAYENALVVGGPQAEACFHLGNVVYRLGQTAAALEHYRQTVELDPQYVAAWNNLGSVLAELGEADLAVEAYRRALAVHGDYADVHYNLADTLDELGRHEEAASHFRAYLRYDSRSAWAAEARRRLARAAGETPAPTPSAVRPG